MYKQLDLFTYIKTGLYDPENYANGYEYMAFQNGDTTQIKAMNEYKAYILEQIKESQNEEKRKQWENALKSIERQIEDFR